MSANLGITKPPSSLDLSLVESGIKIITVKEKLKEKESSLGMEQIELNDKH